MLAAEGGDRTAVFAPDGEAEVSGASGREAGGPQVEGVTVLGDLKTAGRGRLMAGVPLLAAFRVCVMAGGRLVLGHGADALAHAVGGAERRGQCGGECGDLQ